MNLLPTRLDIPRLYKYSWRLDLHAPDFEIPTGMAWMRYKLIFKVQFLLMSKKWFKIFELGFDILFMLRRWSDGESNDICDFGVMVFETLEVDSETAWFAADVLEEVGGVCRVGFGPVHLFL